MAQTVAANGTVQAIGNATVAFNPNQAQFSVGVVTQGTTAQDAGAQNATISTAVQSALKAALGNNGNIQTVNYSVTPRYSSGNTPLLLGFTASNTVLVTTFNLSNIGVLIDTATKAGANSIGGVSFGLQNPDPFIQQALSQASKQALAYASSIASGVGGRLGNVMSAQQGYSFAPTGIANTGAAGAAPTTPIAVGTVSVSASVTVVVQLLQ